MEAKDNYKLMPQSANNPNNPPTNTNIVLHTEFVLTSESPRKEEFGETPYRFYIVVSYFLLTFANGFQWVTFSSCAENFGDAYDMPSWKVNMFSLIYMIIYPFVCIP